MSTTLITGADVTSDESVRGAAAIVEREVGHLDGLVDNAGVTGPLNDLREYDADDMAAVLATNVVGCVRVIQTFLPLLHAADPGLTATDLGGGHGHSVHDGADSIVAFALDGPGGPTGAYRDRDSDLPW